MTNSQRQHGIGSLAPNEKIVGKPGGLVEPGVKQYGIFKKIKKFGKKIFKSPLGKAALLGAGAWGLGGLGGATGMARFSPSAWGKGIGAMRSGLFGKAAVAGYPGQSTAATKGLWGKLGKFGYGKAALLGAGALGVAAPFLGGDEDEEIIDDWSVTPSSIAKIRQMAKDRHSSLAFLPPASSVMSGYYGSKDGGIVGLANGGQPAEAQAEQMLKMEYQKYRNQGGTMSYQQFKMAVLQQAQGQGPMAQGQGERPMFQGGELVTDESMVEETPTGMMEENVEEVQGEPTREQLEALAMEIFQLRLEELDEEQLMVVYQAAMEQQPEEMAMQEEDIQFDPQMAAPAMAAHGGRIGYERGRVVRPGGYQGNTAFQNWLKSNYNITFDQAHDLGWDAYTALSREFRNKAEGGRIGNDEGGLMRLGGMEKDYRQEGGFVPLGGEEKADDVPARLSKNEFVFTADAVRAAGGGDIDQGAEVMENVMNNLESGGEISEESQGAQEMYDQQQMLQSRMA